MTRHEFVMLLTGSGHSGPPLLACFDAQEARALAAEAEVERLRGALEKIATTYKTTAQFYLGEIARAALTATETK